MTSFHINEQLSKLPDVQRTYMWKCFVPDIDKMTNGVMSTSDFILRCRNIVIPSRGNEPIESSFLGMKQMFPGKPIFTNTMILMLEEFEDQNILKGLYQWQENLFSVDPKSGHGGTSIHSDKSMYSTDVLLRMYKQVGDLEELEKQVRVKNAWISNIDDTSLDYTTQESVKYTVTLTYDYWTLEDKN